MKDNLDANPDLSTISGRRAKNVPGAILSWTLESPHFSTAACREFESSLGWDSWLPRSLPGHERLSSTENGRASQWSQILETSRRPGISATFISVFPLMCRRWPILVQLLIEQPATEETIDTGGHDSLSPGRKDLYLSSVYY